MKRPECPFCGQVIERPMEVPPYHAGQVPVGTCVCGAVYACDVTGKNLGQALLEALAYACNFDFELATELKEGSDYNESLLEHYDLVSHLIVERGFLQGRRVQGKLIFLRLSEELMEEIHPGSIRRSLQIPQKEAQVNTKRISKGQVEAWVLERNLDTIRALASQSDEILRYIQRLLYTPEPEHRGKAAEALGLACAVVATYKPNVVSRILQNLLYSISDTASSSWGAFEAVSEIISQRFDLYSSYVAYLYPFLGDESKREEGFKAIVRIAKEHPKVFRRLTLHFIPYLKDPNPVLRAHAVRIMGFLKASEVRGDLLDLANDITPVSFYEEGSLKTKTISELVAEALKALEA